jgi:F-type H+-transporting ATPase subunit b
LEGLGINLGYFLVQVFSFLIVFVLLRALAYRPILEMLERRRKSVAQGLEDARVAAEARANAEKDAQSLMVKTQHEANEHLRKAAEQAEQTGREIKAAAEKEAADIRSAALAEADQAKQHALAELRDQVAALALAAAEKIIRESLDEKRQRTLIAEFFSGIKGPVRLERRGHQRSAPHPAGARYDPPGDRRQARLRLDHHLPRGHTPPGRPGDQRGRQDARRVRPWRPRGLAPVAEVAPAARP